MVWFNDEAAAFESTLDVPFVRVLARLRRESERLMLDFRCNLLLGRCRRRTKQYGDCKVCH